MVGKPNDVLCKLHNGLVVSCQALEDEALYSPFIMGRLAKAAVWGGACGIRCNTGVDIREIKANVSVPIIGLVKRHYPDSEVYIGATLAEVREAVEAGADIVALDATKRLRPQNQTLAAFISEVKAAYPGTLLMADISVVEEAVEAEKIGFDVISTTLSGYTDYSPQRREPDFRLMADCVKTVSIPIFAEGRIKTPEQAKRALGLGVFAVIVGSAITRPQMITEDFVRAISDNSH